MMMMQAGGGLLPWWVLYAMVLGATYGVFRLGRGKGGVAVPVGCFAFIPMIIVGLMVLPGKLFLLTLFLSLLPLLAGLVGIVKRGRVPGAAGAEPARRRMWTAEPQMIGQPNADAVLRSKAMAQRYEEGMPRDARFVARVRYVKGIGDLSARPVDLFTGGGQLWVAPLRTGTPPYPIPTRNVLSVDVWPDPFGGPPSLRLNWSPPAGELTTDVVFEAMPNVPQEQVMDQLKAIGTLVTTAIGAETRAAREEETAAVQPMTMPITLPIPSPHACANCGETIPPGADACPRCAAPM